jgi:hypothetical protein
MGTLQEKGRVDLWVRISDRKDPFESMGLKPNLTRIAAGLDTERKVALRSRS